MLLAHNRFSLCLCALVCAVAAASAQKGGLDLPKPQPAPAPLPPPADSPAAGSASAPLAATPAVRILEQLTALKAPGPEQMDEAFRALLAMGESGLVAARSALANQDVPPLLVSARVLLAGGSSSDRELLAGRIAARVPTAACEGLLQIWVAAEPDPAASLRWLIGALEHPQVPMRLAAERALTEREDPELLASLATLGRSSRSDARQRAVSVAASKPGQAARELLLAALGDANATVASTAARALAERPEAERAPCLEELLAELEAGELLLRQDAYALLALVEREDREHLALVPERLEPKLLAALRSDDRVAAGSAALALAGLGFRSTSAAALDWLDGEVPVRLIETIYSEDFDPHLGMLAPAAQRRLSLISGEFFGSDGPAWRRWWLETQGGFRARRALLSATPADYPRLLLAWRSSATGEAFVLAGPQAPPAASAQLLGEEFLLTAEQALQLGTVLERQRWFSAERLPGQYGDVHRDVERFEFMLDGRAKGFVLGNDSLLEGYPQLREQLLSLRAAQLWQRYRNPVTQADLRAFAAREGPWWSAEHAAPERARKLVELVLAHVLAQAADQRGRGLDELEDLYRNQAAADLGDVAPLNQVLASESFLGPQALRVLDLLLQAARAPAWRAGLLAAPRADAPIELELARVIAATVLEHFPPPALGFELALARILGAAPVELARELSAHPAPQVRATCAARLAQAGGELDLQCVAQLLRDSDPLVEAAAVRVVGEQRLEALRGEVLVRARLARPQVRAAALWSLGHLGGAAALDPLLLAVADADPVVQAAGIEGLAELADPASASLLARVFARGSRAVGYEAARRGLLRLGEAAWTELLAQMHSGALEQRRGAALLIAYQGLPLAFPVLLSMYSERPDEQLASELAILSCFDARAEPKAAESWWVWWEDAPREDSRAWLLAGASRLGLATPPAEALRPPGTLRGADFLLGLIQGPKAYLAERARRELEQWLLPAERTRLEQLPPPGALREAWGAQLRAWLATRLLP